MSRSGCLSVAECNRSAAAWGFRGDRRDCTRPFMLVMKLTKSWILGCGIDDAIPFSRASSGGSIHLLMRRLSKGYHASFTSEASLVENTIHLLLFRFHRPTFPVDSKILRVAWELGWVEKRPTPGDVRKLVY